MADLSALAAALKASLNPDAATRQPAQALLEAGCATPGALVSLMQLSTTAGVEPDVAMAAAVLFKNEVKKRWPEGSTGIQDGEKQVIRQNLIAIICSCSLNLQPMYLEAMRRISCEDYPSLWPSAVEECGSRFAAANFASPQSFIAPLHCLLLLAKVFQYKPEDQRAPVEALCSAISPALLQTLQQSLQQPYTPVIAEIQLIVAKIFWSLTMFSLPQYFRNADTFGVWLQALLALSTHEPPPPVAAMSPDEAWERSAAPCCCSPPCCCFPPRALACTFCDFPISFTTLSPLLVFPIAQSPALLQPVVAAAQACHVSPQPPPEKLHDARENEGWPSTCSGCAARATLHPGEVACLRLLFMHLFLFVRFSVWLHSLQLQF